MPRESQACQPSFGGILRPQARLSVVSQISGVFVPFSCRFRGVHGVSKAIGMLKIFSKRLWRRRATRGNFAGLRHVSPVATAIYPCSPGAMADNWIRLEVARAFTGHTTNAALVEWVRRHNAAGRGPRILRRHGRVERESLHVVIQIRAPARRAVQSPNSDVDEIENEKWIALDLASARSAHPSNASFSEWVRRWNSRNADLRILRRHGFVEMRSLELALEERTRRADLRKLALADHLRRVELRRNAEPCTSLEREQRARLQNRQQKFRARFRRRSFGTQ